MNNDNETDLQILNRERNRYLYSGDGSSLVAWTLEAGWTYPDLSLSQVRGACGAMLCNSISGEIAEAK
mgnify:CR=1 FL=1